MANKFQGLARGPIDHQSSSVINSIANGTIEMGSAVELNSTISTSENLPRVSQTDAETDLAYGIAVGGDVDGIYSTDGAPSGDDSTRATNGAGQGVVIVTQGRCLARVDGSGTTILIGSALGAAASGKLILADAVTNIIVARALQGSTADDDIIAVDVQREGVFS